MTLKESLSMNMKGYMMLSVNLEYVVNQFQLVARVDIKQLEASNGHIKNNNLIQ